jgi:holdfast attachment protein HfaA
MAGVTNQAPTMPHKSRQIALAMLACAALASTQAWGQSMNASDYNNPYGMTQAQENQPVNPDLRDANGNLTVINGQFTTSTMSQQTGVQSMSVLGSAALGSTLGGSTVSTGVGFGGPTTTGTATAIGNSLNVVTVGNNNTVVVNSQQTDNGNQTATVNVNGH